MAHYLAEVLIKAQKSTGADKALAERECFEIILQLWKHRATVGGPRPLESFEPIFRALKGILNDQYAVYFERTNEMLDPNAEKWLVLASGIDRTARDLIRWCIAQASSDVVEKEKVWLESKTAAELDDGDDLRIARMLQDDVRIFFQTEDQVSPNDTAELQALRNRLDAFISLTVNMQKYINEALQKNS
jgi:hypothetical protein